MTAPARIIAATLLPSIPHRRESRTRNMRSFQGAAESSNTSQNNHRILIAAKSIKTHTCTFVAAAVASESAASSITSATANATASSSTSMSDSLLPNSQNGRPQHHSNMRRRLDDSAAVGRHVHFSDEIQGILVPSPKDMPENEKRSIWYNVRFVLLSACFVCLAPRTAPKFRTIDRMVVLMLMKISLKVLTFIYQTP